MLRQTEIEPVDLAIPGAWIWSDGKMKTVTSVVGFPERLRLRLELQKNGYTRMPTAIVMPDEELTKEDLWSIAITMGEHNRNYGLPDDTHDLVIKTRSMNPQIGGLSGGTYNPLLQIRNIWSDTPKMFNMGKEKTWERVRSLDDWRHNLGSGVVMIIHAEHPEMQRKSLHGQVSVNRLGIGWHFQVGSGYQHAREVGMPGGIHASGEGSSLEAIVFAMINGRMGSSLTGTGIFDMVRLGVKVEPYIEKLQLWILDMNSRLGKQPTYDFRIYPYSLRINAGLELFDADFRFGGIVQTNVVGGSVLRGTGIRDIDTMVENKLGRD